MDAIPFAIILFAVLFLGLYLNAIDRKRAELRAELKKITCPPHSWMWVPQPGSDVEYLKCMVCNQSPNTYSGQEE
jgi:hypothetical protein